MSLLTYDQHQVFHTALLTDLGVWKSLGEAVAGQRRELDDAAAAAFYRAMPSLPQRQRELVQESCLASGHGKIGFVNSLGALGKHFFALEPEGVRTRQEAVIPWLEYFGTKLSPVPLVAALLRGGDPAALHDTRDLVALLEFGFMPPPTDLDVARPTHGGADNERLADNHIHVSNLAPPTAIWLYALRRPYRCVASLFARIPRAKRLRRMVGLSLSTTPEAFARGPVEFLGCLRLASWIRRTVADFNRRAIGGERADLWGEGLHAFERLGSGFPDCALALQSSGCAPAVRQGESLAEEGLWWMKAFEILDDLGDPGLEALLHVYHLFHAMFSRLVVQQFELRGFELFEGYASNPIRDVVEDRDKKLLATSLTRLRCSGANGHLELRISPKPSFPAFCSRKLLPLTRALDALEWSGSNRGVPQEDEHDSVEATESVRDARQTVSITVHFIKEEDRHRPRADGPAIPRHAGVRASLVQQAATIKRARRHERRIVGIDAANSEFYAPPEVFAPVFREMAHWEKTGPGISPLRMTFHVGEEFYHPLCGLRAIAEVLEFLGMPNESRIGHGMALGLDFHMWHLHVPAFMVPIQEWLDSLVWLVVRGASGAMDRWEPQIARWSREIYGHEVSVQELSNAWRLRELPPTIRERGVLRSWRDRVESLRGEIGWRCNWLEEGMEQARAPRAPRPPDSGNDPGWLYYRYHFDEGVRLQGRKIIEPGLKSEELERLATDMETAAERLIKQLAERRIAIEVCPTSNLRITQVRHWREHPLFRLAPVETADGRPEVSLCTDNPGLCQTTIALEACAARQIASELPNSSVEKSQDWLGRLATASNRVAFRCNRAGEERDAGFSG